MTEQWTCAADNCDKILPEERVRLEEFPLEESGEWVETGESDEYGEIKDWTGEWQTVNVGACKECERRDREALAEVMQMIQQQNE